MTPRERESLTLFASGYPRYADVAEHLGISHATVKTHAYSIYLTLRARNKLHAVAIGIREGWIE
jgi:DNA-binding CsgD family transcriptional regulator